jgi:hypothetical protein
MPILETDLLFNVYLLHVLTSMYTCSPSQFLSSPFTGSLNPNRITCCPLSRFLQLDYLLYSFTI